MAPLRACPFCRVPFGPEDGARCPDCDVELVSFSDLPLSEEARALDGEPEDPNDAELGWADFGLGRGALLVLAAAGLVAFFCPWVIVIRPEEMVLRGFDLARGRAGWLWGGATGFFVLLPLVWTRRSVARLRGARVIATLFAGLTWVEVAMLVAFPPRRGLLPLELEWTWGLYASALVSLLATVVALRLGGPWRAPPPPAVAPPPESSRDRVLH